MARKRRTPEEVLADEQERARRQRERVRAARARAHKANADHGAVVARHVGEVVVRLAASEEHAGDARAVIDWAVSHMPARGQAARQRWRAPWDPAASLEGGAVGSGEPAGGAVGSGEPAAPDPPVAPEPKSGWAERLFARRPSEAEQAAWDQDSIELAERVIFGHDNLRKTPEEAMSFAAESGITEEAIPKMERWAPVPMQERGWRWRVKRWYAPPRP